MGESLLSVEPEYSGCVELSQESQISTQDLSQGSTDIQLTTDGAKPKKKKSSKKVKKKKDKDKDKSSKDKSEKSSKSKSGRSSSRRPEPEGGNAPASYVDDYERIIYSNDALFSDVELTDEDYANFNKDCRRPHRANRQGRDGAILIPCTQLGINSNTMIKFAIIGTELQNVIQVSLKRMEQEVSGTTRKITLLEEDLERNEERLQTATERLEEASKAADESERARRSLESKLFATEERAEAFEEQLKTAQIVAQEAEMKYDETARKLKLSEDQIERLEEMSEDYGRKYKHYEAEVSSLTTNIRSFEINEEQASQREDSYEETIRDLTQRLKDAENRATEAERTVSKLQKEVDRLEDELGQQTEKYQSLKLEMQQTLADLQDI
ncbi:tropomyosin isoform X10 [Haliotis rufescens]|uniref:tropomyosin isoform X10 n=1 Tax=Haliotis rufescens TaxID=6454 RepID=UPI001EB0AD89|nr:tropomyosin isoform X10 [Haliotis rufescens]